MITVFKKKCWKGAVVAFISYGLYYTGHSGGVTEKNY